MPHVDLPGEMESSDLSSDEDQDEINSDDVDSDDLEEHFGQDEGEKDQEIPMQQDFVHLEWSSVNRGTNILGSCQATLQK